MDAFLPQLLEAIPSQAVFLHDGLFLWVNCCSCDRNGFSSPDICGSEALCAFFAAEQAPCRYTECSEMWEQIRETAYDLWACSQDCRTETAVLERGAVTARL